MEADTVANIFHFFHPLCYLSETSFLILQHVSVENWLFYGVPQMLALLQPDGSGTASGYDAALIHQYCTVLANLIHHNPRALQYCITTYAEELRQVVTT